MLIARRDLQSYLIMGLSILVSGKVTPDMVKEFRSGPMEPCIKDSGRTIWLMDRVPFCMYQVISTKDSGNEIRPMAKVSTLTAMELSMMEIGRMIYSTVLVLKPGTTTRNTKVNIQKVKSMALELTFGRMALSIQENGRRTRFMDKVNTLGMMVGCMKAIGKTIIWMVTAATYGKMDESMKDST